MSNIVTGAVLVLFFAFFRSFVSNVFFTLATITVSTVLNYYCFMTFIFILVVHDVIIYKTYRV